MITTDMVAKLWNPCRILHPRGDMIIEPGTVEYERDIPRHKQSTQTKIKTALELIQLLQVCIDGLDKLSQKRTIS